eukprot:CAMPEP_0180447884 /NCGR_PEP_ID=MMETSP1036_2-20121128/16937_1 /TAXON_ID=632150 /ORGANISM="Azadinium spinosum, Strain 3D9" /LENGTH=124 /DNA_ID=CAMNT_0022454275 /DNA_START=526 /DNA_END=901 /DNA_ORIENTATION=-
MLTVEMLEGGDVHRKHPRPRRTRTASDMQRPHAPSSQRAFSPQGLAILDALFASSCAQLELIPWYLCELELIRWYFWDSMSSPSIHLHHVLQAHPRAPADAGSAPDATTSRGGRWGGGLDEGLR